MNNKKTLYILISISVLINVALLSYLLGANRYSSYGSFGMKGRNHMYCDEDYCKEHHENIESWDNMQEHMYEMHGDVDIMHSEVDYNKPVAETHNKTHDFGQISKSNGIVSTTFEIENHGKQTLEIGDISTSCGCTSAEVDKTTLEFNEEAELTVYFDPNFHEEPEGKFTRSVFVKTNDEDLPEMQFDIYVEILD